MTKPGTPPISTGHDPNTEMFLYIKYRWKEDALDVVCPPAYADWKQLCMYLGHPDLKQGEMDFVYGGLQATSKGMEDAIVLYFENIKGFLIETYEYDFAFNDDYQPLTSYKRSIRL